MFNINIKFLFTLFTVLLLANSTQFRYLQGWEDPNCSQWSTDGQTCLKCIWRSYNDTTQNKCIRVDDNCKTWSQTNGECLTCYDSYGDSFYNGSAINGKCPYYNGPQPQPNPVFEYDINCKCYSDDRKCLQCYDLFQLDTRGRCQAFPNGCFRFENGVCVECISGYYLDNQGDCNPLPANCSSVDQNGKCILCQSGFVLNQQGNCVLSMQNCAVMDPLSQLCLQCDLGYYLDQQGECNFLPSNCNATDNQGNCIECLEGYVLDSFNDCQILPRNCFFTDSNGICTECIDGYYLDQSKQCIKLLQNCLSANPQGQCTQCADKYILRNGVCQKSIDVGVGIPNPDCARQNDQGLCIQCRAFYNLVNGTCIPTGQNPFCKQGACQCGTGNCLACKQGYFLDSQSICTAIGQNCKQYSRLNGSCTTCNKGYKLNEGQCLPESQNLVTNLNCRNQTQNGTCTSCRKYYALQNGDCVPTGKNPKCHIWNQNKVCVYCYYPYLYYLDNNSVCVRKNQDCRQINPQTGQCTRCNKFYKLQNGQCNINIPNNN